MFSNISASGGQAKSSIAKRNPLVKSVGVRDTLVCVTVIGRSNSMREDTSGMCASNAKRKIAAKHAES
jgi:hypothetical protein